MLHLIDANELEREGWSLSRTFQKDKNTMVYEIKKPTDFPAVKKQSGKWITKTYHHKDDEQDYYYLKTHCSVCGIERKIGWTGAIFCPHCGAYMEEEEC